MWHVSSSLTFDCTLNAEMFREYIFMILLRVLVTINKTSDSKNPNKYLDNKYEQYIPM